MSVMYGDLDQLLREHGRQVTAQRSAIMRAVSSRPHAMADELVDDVRAVVGSISRQAVYGTLSVLVEKNLGRRIQATGSACPAPTPSSPTQPGPRFCTARRAA